MEHLLGGAEDQEISAKGAGARGVEQDQPRGSSFKSSLGILLSEGL